MPSYLEIPGSPQATRPQSRYMIVFLAVLVTLIGGLYLQTGRLPYFREDALDFRTLDDDDLLVISSLTRRQGGSLKVGYVETFEPPTVGLFANQEIRLVMLPIWTHRRDGRWLYVEQASVQSIEQPYRQRVYRVHRDALGVLRSDVYTLHETWWSSPVAPRPWYATSSTRRASTHAWMA